MLAFNTELEVVYCIADQTLPFQAVAVGLVLMCPEKFEGHRFHGTTSLWTLKDFQLLEDTTETLTFAVHGTRRLQGKEGAALYRPFTLSTSFSISCSTSLTVGSGSRFSFCTLWNVRHLMRQALWELTDASQEDVSFSKCVSLDTDFKERSNFVLRCTVSSALTDAPTISATDTLTTHPMKRN